MFPGIMNKTGNLDEMIFLQFFIQVASVRLQKPLCYSYDSLVLSLMNLKELQTSCFGAL